MLEQNQNIIVDVDIIIPSQNEIGMWDSLGQR